VRTAMFSLIARFFAPSDRSFGAGASGSGIANSLLERAGQCAGTDPHHAQELRDAAMAYMRVVR
jgi:hypothetical protein